MRCMRPNIVDHSKVNPHPTTYPGYISLVDQGMPYIKPGSKLAIAEDVFQVCYDDHWVLRFDVNESHGLVWNMVSSGEWGYWGGWICQMLLSSLGDWAPCWERLCPQGKMPFSVYRNNSDLGTHNRFKCLPMTGNGTVWTRCTPGEHNFQYVSVLFIPTFSGSRTCPIHWRRRQYSGRLASWPPLDASLTGSQC